MPSSLLSQEITRVRRLQTSAQSSLRWLNSLWYISANHDPSSVAVSVLTRFGNQDPCVSPECLAQRDSHLHIPEQRTGSPEDNSVLPKMEVVYGVAESQTQLSACAHTHMHTCVHTHTHTKVVRAGVSFQKNRSIHPDIHFTDEETKTEKQNSSQLWAL